MIDRHAGYIVILRDDLHEDDSRAVMTALRMIHGVISVQPVLADYGQVIAEERRDRAWRGALLAILKSGPDDSG